MKILVVDDEPSMRGLLLRIFRQHDTAEARNVEEAKQMLELHEFDVVISDNQMPGPCGVELLAHIDVFHPDVHRILFTASPPADLSSLVNQGVVQDFVHKHALRDLVELCATKLKRRGLRS